MVVNFIVIVSAEEDGVTDVFPFPALLPAKKKADKIAAEDLPPYDIVVWDVNANATFLNYWNVGGGLQHGELSARLAHAAGALCGGESAGAVGD